MRSIRLFLVASILATLTLFNFVAALQGYQSSMDEADVLFDNQLQDIAQLVSNLDVGDITNDIVLENGMSFQIWNQNELVAKSLDAPKTPISEIATGFGDSNFDGYRWRTFSRVDPQSGRRVIVAERTDLRFVLAENVVLQSVSPILLGIPLVGLLIWTIVSLGLRPLKILSTELKNKQAHDLTPIYTKNSTKELQQVVESTNGFIKRLDKVLEREKRFSADAAHELRTPISALKVQLHNLGDEIDPNSEAYLQLQRGVSRMQHLIEQLLSLYRTTPEQFAENCQSVDLFHIVQNQIAEMYANFEDKDQSLELQGRSVKIDGDQFALETLVSNLLSNANKYTPAGGKISVVVSETPTKVVLSVEDTGPGISLEDKERVFDRFYRADRLIDDAVVPGCGLGLTIIAHIAALHNAKVDIEDAGETAGCNFKISFEK